MPKYGSYHTEEAKLYLLKSGRGEDAAVALYRAIQNADPDLENAFTPEVAEELFGKKERNTKKDS
ncbi:MAG: hypothetical protein ABIG08_02705 [bacterium]